VIKFKSYQIKFIGSKCKIYNWKDTSGKNKFNVIKRYNLTPKSKLVKIAFQRLDTIGHN